MRSLLTLYAIILLLLLHIFCPNLVYAQNNISNLSFEQGANNQPSGWRFETWDKGITSLWVDGGHNGRKSVAIESTQKGWARWMSKTLLLPYSRYRFSGWVKTLNVVADSNGGAGFSVGNFEIKSNKAIQGTNGWQKVEFEFDTEGEDSGVLECILGVNGPASGKAWFDDIKLELIKSEKLSPRISIDITKTREPISKYIYGQFIEHLGRCIYGGIWAEVVNDRKFYYKPGEKESPWRIIGDKSCLAMSPTPYVGYNSPEIFIADSGKTCGIEQVNIPLLADMDYTGRIVLAGVPGKADVRVTLSWGDADKQSQSFVIKGITSNYTKIPIAFQSKGTTQNGKLTIEMKGEGRLAIGTISLMPANNIEGFRSDVIQLLKELNSPVYRWPGGNFVSGYNWKDGIGDRDRRPPRKNPAWTGVEHNDMGIDEFMQFCRILNAEPFIAVNSGLGDVAMAAEEVEYCNGAVGTTMGHLRADNGHPQPYNVKFWSVGNEMYGNWQLGHMPLSEYVQKHNVFAKAMRAVDSSAVLVGVGAVGEWDEAMLSNCADHMDLISEHIYRQDWHGGGLMTHVKQLADDIRRVGQAHRDYRKSIPSLKGKDIRIAMDEWNYWYGPHIFGELGTRYFWRDGMGIAAGLNEYFRNSDIFYMANYAQTVNVIGCIKTTGIAAAFETTGLVLKMYREKYGVIPVDVTGSQAPLDITAALNEDRTQLTISVVNPTGKEYSLPYNVSGAKVGKSALLHHIRYDDDMAYNEPGKEQPIKIESFGINSVGKSLVITPKSVNIFVLSLTK